MHVTAYAKIYLYWPITKYIDIINKKKNEFIRHTNQNFIYLLRIILNYENIYK